MKIAHASLPADNPERAARILAEIMSGEALRFPPGGPRTWMAWSGDEAIELEIAPRGLIMNQDSREGGNWRVKAEPQSGSASHLAICVSRSSAEILEIARAAGWPAQRYDRAGFFHVNEVWVEGHFLIEFLDPADAAAYEKSMTLTHWKSAFNQPEA